MAPTTTVPAPAAMPSVADFVADWNAGTSGTNVPQISKDQATELTGDYAGYYLVTLTPTNSPDLPPQVGLLAQVTAPGSGQLAEVMLVWIPGADDAASSDFYWEAFGVLTQTVTPGTTPDETAAIEQSLGKQPGMPPFTTPASTTAGDRSYSLFSQDVDGPNTGPVTISAILVR